MIEVLSIATTVIILWYMNVSNKYKVTCKIYSISKIIKGHRMTKKIFFWGLHLQLKSSLELQNKSEVALFVPRWQCWPQAKIEVSVGDQLLSGGHKLGDAHRSSWASDVKGKDSSQPLTKCLEAMLRESTLDKKWPWWSLSSNSLQIIGTHSSSMALLVPTGRCWAHHA